MEFDFTSGIESELDTFPSPAAKSADMPYELFFEGSSPEVKKLKALVAVEQDDRDFAPAR